MVLKELTMQQQLADLGTADRYHFTGVFERYGVRHDEPTILLTTVRLNGKQLVALELWLNLTKDFRGLGALKPGDKLSFSGRVAPYINDYPGQDKTDFSTSSVAYRIGYPSHVKLIKPLLRRHRQALPANQDALIQQIVAWNSPEQG